MGELDDQLTRELVAALKELRDATAAMDEAKAQGGPPFDRARERGDQAIERVRELARRLTG
jgi:chorismate mutase